MKNNPCVDNQFIPYELAVELKELGFNERCLADYVSGTYGFKEVVNELEIWNDEDVEILHSKIKAPLWQQAFDWLWNKTDKYIIPIPNDDKKWLCLGTKFDTYEEARKACLEKLIELCKKN